MFWSKENKIRDNKNKVFVIDLNTGKEVSGHPTIQGALEFMKENSAKKYTIDILR